MGIRRERVVLDLEDHLSGGMVKAAGSTALLNRELKSLSHDSVRTRAAVSDIDRPTQSLGRSAGSTSREVDKLSGRMRILTDAAVVLGPSLIPIGAVGVPAVAGLAAQLGFAAAAGGVAILAFQGVGDTLKALNTAALNPTTQNLEKAQVALEGLSPQAQALVAQLGHMIPELKQLRDVAAAGMFPGLTAGLTSLETGLPKVRGVISAVSTELGSIAADAGASLASEKWTSFLDFVGREAPPALADMAKAAGHTAHAVAALWMATNPLNEDFSKWLVEATADIDRWASSLSKTQGFADFVAYVESTGPKVASTLGAIANAAIQIVEAASPLGGPVLTGIKALADIVSAVANSDLGTPLFTAAAGLALFNRAMGLTKSLSATTWGGMAAGELKAAAGIRTLVGDLMILQRESRLVTLPGKNFIGPLTQAQAAATRLKSTLPAVAKTTAVVGALAIASTGAADSIGLTNTASLGLAGSIAGPMGAAVGGAVGLLLDAKSATQGFADELKRADLAARGFDVSAIQKELADAQRQKRDLQNTTGVGDYFSDSLKALRGASLTSSAVDNLDTRIGKLKDQLDFTRERAQQQYLKDGFVGTADGIDRASQSTQEFQRSLKRLNAVLSGRASFRDYQQALDDFTKRQTDRAKVLDQIGAENADFAAAMAKNDRDMAAVKPGDKGRVADLQAQRAEEVRRHNERLKNLQDEADALKNTTNDDLQAGRDTNALLDNIAKTALTFAQSLSGPARAEFLAGARRDFIKAAEAAHMGRDEAKKLADDVLGLSAVKGEPKIVVDANGAYHVIDLVAARLERLTRRTYKLNIQAQAGKNQAAVMDIHTGADGMTVPGQRWPYADKTLLLAAPGEELITNRHGEADAFRADRAAGRIPAYADGGTVGRHSSGSAHGTQVMRMSDDDVSRIVRGLATLRPIAGVINVQPHNYSEFLRQQENIDRAAGIGGPPT